jgi:hypothetical protein
VPAHPDVWRCGTHQGSWWEDWAAWTAVNSGDCCRPAAGGQRSVSGVVRRARKVQQHTAFYAAGRHPVIIKANCRRWLLECRLPIAARSIQPTDQRKTRWHTVTAYAASRAPMTAADRESSPREQADREELHHTAFDDAAALRCGRTIAFRRGLGRTAVHGPANRHRPEPLTAINRIHLASGALHVESNGVPPCDLSR